jgi:ATP-dependent RNA helicase DeaD
MPKEIAAITKNYMKNPVEVTIGARNAGAENIKHVCYTVQARDRYLALKRIADYNPGIYGIIFCRTRKETQEIADKLIQDGYNADSLHGDLSQSQRDYVMQKFRVRNISLLVATDVAARGLDVDDLTHVINYNIPDDLDVYTHRSGRTGRTGKAGISVVIVHLKEKFLLKQIEKKIGKTFTHGNIPTGRQICEKQLFHLIDKMEKVEIDHSEIDPYLPVIFKKLDWLDKEELIKRFVSLEFNRFLEYYRNATELSNPEKHGDERYSDKRKGNSRKSEEGYTRLFINIGKMDGLYPNQLMELIRENAVNPKIKVGKIDLLKTFSFFEVENSGAADIIKNLKGIEFGNRKISVEEASEKPSGENRGYERSNNRGKERNQRRSKERDRSRGGRKESSGGNLFDKNRNRGKERKKESSGDRNFKKEKSPKNKYKPGR